MAAVDAEMPELVISTVDVNHTETSDLPIVTAAVIHKEVLVLAL
ncbi:hypothetical protein GCM10008986_26200 [Salinibacillus aidingensis]|uniref:Uncharacterized protein n=1 Tax=Salinibacillus aidingensis TaxID=237684 RepID=A0ABN1BIK3_9BACI